MAKGCDVVDDELGCEATVFALAILEKVSLSTLSVELAEGFEPIEFHILIVWVGPLGMQDFSPSLTPEEGDVVKLIIKDILSEPFLEPEGQSRPVVWMVL
jgi:hypothetical protein